ncbi:MAG: hypothetical protein MRY78_02275 [Saprospiraceae bacterium]|nr:hypothetical protein [Saprospiraceae bacterium]
MQRVSTNLTLFLKFFIPVFWLVFFGAFTILIFAYDLEYVAQIPIVTFRIIAVLFMLSGIALFYFTLFRLKRVEMGEQFVYVTDYFKHVRYPYHNIDRIEESTFGFLKVVSIYLKTPGSFGKRVLFIASGKKYDEFWKNHLELKASLGLS